ncbi:MAG: glycosyltransferase family 2 protein [Deltaproteobacteria bacterium]|nr:glycosyltransferase family 2 protein [Deltaproteobacteria bacterium]
MKKLSVILAVYNEAGNIAPLVRSIRNVISSTDELIVVDDASTDTTAQEIDPALAILVRHPVNRGKGAAIRTGIGAASGELVLLMDGDGQDDPQDIPQVVNPVRAGKADFAIGSRFLNPGQNSFVTPINRLGNRCLTSLVNFFLGVRITDSQAAFKCIRMEALKDIHLESDRYEVETEMLIKAVDKKLKIVEVPVHRYSRKYGKSHLYQIPFGRFKFGLRIMRVFIKSHFQWR